MLPAVMIIINNNIYFEPVSQGITSMSFKLQNPIHQNQVCIHLMATEISGNGLKTVEAGCKK